MRVNYGEILGRGREGPGHWVTAWDWSAGCQRVRPFSLARRGVPGCCPVETPEILYAKFDLRVGLAAPEFF